MRWESKYSKNKKRVGEIEIVTKFLWFKKEINNIVKWLETATWERKVIKEELYDRYEYNWKDLRWIE